MNTWKRRFKELLLQETKCDGSQFVSIYENIKKFKLKKTKYQ